MSGSIPPEILKENSDFCCKLLTVINNSHFDSVLKLADLTPAHKDDDTTNEKIYHNVSLLPKLQLTCKISQVLSFGYRKGFSAQHALLSMLEKWRKSLGKGAMERGWGGGGGEVEGFDKNSLSLVKCYLTDRWQRTKVNASFSSLVVTNSWSTPGISFRATSL